MRKASQLVADIESAIRRLVYGPTTPISDDRLKKLESDVRELHETTKKLDDRVARIESAPDPWAEFVRVVRGKRF